MLTRFFSTVPDVAVVLSWMPKIVEPAFVWTLLTVLLLTLYAVPVAEARLIPWAAPVVPFCTTPLIELESMASAPVPMAEVSSIPVMVLPT